MRHFHFASVSLDRALEVIQSGNGLVKTICSPEGDDQSWDLFLPKFSENYDEEKDSYACTDLTSTTLLPLDGKIHLFEPANPKYRVMVGLLFDRLQCEVKYIFEGNACSKDWLNKKDAVIPPQITLYKLTKLLLEARSRGVILDNNEVIAGVSWDSLVGVFATKNDLFSRLNALVKQNLIYRELSKFLPILIITPRDGAVVYEEQQKFKDIKNALAREPGDPLRVLAENGVNPRLRQEALEFEDKPQVDQGLNEAKDVLRNAAVPVDLKFLILDYLDLAELVDLSKQNANNPVDISIKKLILEVLKNKRELDLQDLCRTLGQPIFGAAVFDLVLTESESFAVIERAIIHLSYLNPASLWQVFTQYLASPARKNPKIIACLLQHGPVIQIDKYPKTVVYIEGDNPWDNEPDIVVKVKQWSPLLEAVLSGNASVANLIANRYPDHMADMMSALDELEKIAERYGDYCDYKLERIAAARKSLLLALKPENGDYYTLSYKDRRLIESYMLEQIDHLPSKTALLAFYAEHANSLYLNQHRHVWLDTVTGRLFPGIKERVLRALQGKLANLEDDRIRPDPEAGKVAIEKLRLKVFLQTKLNDLKSQKSRMFCCLFSASNACERKIRAIESSLVELENIVNLNELKLFTECQLINTDLTARRSFGLAPSETLQMLDNFHLSLRV